MSYEPPFEVVELSFEEALAHLHATLRLGISPMLETVEDMLAELGDPDLCFEAIQIAGTNGKTSTARYSAALLSGEGLTTALYTSPELVSYVERMEVAGAPVSEEAFAHGISCAIAAGERVNGRRVESGERPYDITEFDLITVGACVVFAEAGVDVAVLECGMGGRWDATSAVKSIRSVAVTGVGLDHMHVLGDTVEAIAAEKAAIIRTGRTCVLGVGTAAPASVEDVFLERCLEQGVNPVLLRPARAEDAAGEMPSEGLREHPELARAGYGIVSRPDRIGGELVVDVVTTRGRYASVTAHKPAYQAANISCAIALVEDYLDRRLDEGRLLASVEACPTPGRFDVVRREPLVLIDACHNPQSVETFLTAVRAIEPVPEKRPMLLCAALADKDVAGMVGLLAPEFPRVMATQTSSSRALPAEELASLFEDAGAEVAGCFDNVDAALGACGDEDIVACGSITLAGEVAALLKM